MNEIQNIVLIGAGNVATHLGLAIQKTGRRIVQVYSRTESSAKQLGGKLKTHYTDALEEINPEADLYIVSVSDSALKVLSIRLNLNEQLIVHTSGSVSMDVLRNSSLNYGVLYPLQTFSKSREVEIFETPICVEANTNKNLEKLKGLAADLSKKVVEINSEQRKLLHLSAVFACNFTNFMYSIADKVLSEHNLDFNLLRPLILETALKVQQVSPAEAQTGPAVRREERIITEHLALLKNSPELQKIYRLLSERIKGIRE